MAFGGRRPGRPRLAFLIQGGVHARQKAGHDDVDGCAHIADMNPVSPQMLRTMLLDGMELAPIDVREELVFSQRHLLWARNVPLSRLELRFARLVPRHSTRIVLIDDNDGLARRAGDVLARAGYTDLSILDGGVIGWEKAGFELFSGVNVPSKAFGEHVEHDSGTPSISADELDALIRGKADMVVVDSRPFDEYQRVSIPTATNVPGAELVLRIHDIAPSSDTLVVVNCAGRTRSIIGAQSLINAGLPNKVVALRNGTMGYNLAGFATESGKNKRALATSAQGLGRAKDAAARVARRFQIERVDTATIDRWRADTGRTLYLFDVRNPDEYAAGHVPGAVSAPGGQLVQATDQYAGTLGARIALIDEHEVRAVMTASWLRQMGWRDVFVLAETGNEKGYPEAPVLAHAAAIEHTIDAAALARLLKDGKATVIDLSLSAAYRKGHIPGAWFAIRSRLKQALAGIPVAGEVVLTSEDGVLAGLAVDEVQRLTTAPVSSLHGGNAGWRAAGHALSSEPLMADEPLDVWLKPYERPNDTRSAMSEYLAWETDLLPRIARDGTTKFMSSH
jgi:rhodanese-related sulfurtransferase